MKLNVYNNSKIETGKIELPKQFNEKVRADLIKRAVLIINWNNRQPYGAKPRAGLRAVGKLSRRRKDYKTSYGIGISRVPRKILSKNGTRLNWVGAVAPGTVKGRRAHPPKADKILQRRMNKKERRMAIRSALSATMHKDLVINRGHKVPEDYPFIIDSNIEELSKTKDIIDALIKLGLEKELERISVKKIRAGRGKMRGRKYNIRKGPLIIVSKKCALINASRNISGVDVSLVHKLNAQLLAPNSTVGRFCLFTKAAVERIEKEGLFLNERTNAENPLKKNTEKTQSSSSKKQVSHSSNIQNSQVKNK